MDNPYTYFDAETYAFDPAAPIIRGARRGIVVDADPGDQPELSLDTTDQQEYDPPMPTYSFIVTGEYADDPDSLTQTLLAKYVEPGDDYDHRIARAAEAFTLKLWEFHRAAYEPGLDSVAGLAKLRGDVLSAVAFADEERITLYRNTSTDDSCYRVRGFIAREP